MNMYIEEMKVDAAYSFAVVGALVAAGIPLHAIDWMMNESRNDPLPSTPRHAADYIRRARMIYDRELGPDNG
jgi:hypothetical protein